MRQGLAVAVSAALLFALLVGCGRETEGRPSSWSIGESRERGLLVAGFDIPAEADLGDYRLLETWVERDPASSELQLVVRLKGPHVDDEPRVRIRGIEDSHYRRIWSERNGPPYEVWLAPIPIPDVLKIYRDDKEVEVRRSEGDA